MHLSTLLVHSVCTIVIHITSSNYNVLLVSSYVFFFIYIHIDSVEMGILDLKLLTNSHTFA